MNPGIYLVHKEIGKSSFDVVRAFKREAANNGHKKFIFGHGGTLDPFAEGLLLVLAGQATRLMDLMHNLPKTYVAKITWGVETDTCDHMGLPVATNDLMPSVPVLNGTLPSFIGWQEQIPPATCAKKINGEAAYKKAHRGEEVNLSASKVYLHEACWASHDKTSSTLYLTCKGGYYVRALARDLGRALGCYAHLSALIRTDIGPWHNPGISCNALVCGEELIPWCSSRFLNHNEANDLLYGRPILLGDVIANQWQLPNGFPAFAQPIRGLYNGKLVALLRERDGVLRSYANLRGGI